MRLAVVAVSLTVLAVAPGVATAATWSAPQNLSGAHLFVGGTGLAVSGDGRALATWGFQDAIGDASRLGASAASRAPGTGQFGRTTALVPRTKPDRRSQTVVGVAAYGRRAALLATLRERGTSPTPHTLIEVRFGRTGGSFGPRRLIRDPGRGPRVTSVRLAVNARGDAALAWLEDRGVRTDRVYIALRRAGHAFGAPRRLATGRLRSVAVAVGASGDVLVAWDARGVLRTRFKPHARDGFRASDTIRSEDAFFADMHPVVTPTGRAVLAWSARFASEGGEPGPAFFEAAVREAGAARFRRARLLERVDFPVDEARPIDAVVDSAGAVAIAWTGMAAQVRAVRGGGPAQDLGPGFLSDLAAGPDGRLLAVWDGGVEAQASVVGAALAPGAGRPFGAPEDTSPAGQDAEFGHAAFDPASGQPTIVFSNRPEGSGHPVNEIRTFAQAVTRSG